MAEPVGPKLFVWPHNYSPTWPPGKVYGYLLLQKVALNNLEFSLNFENPRNKL